jgi:CcmD family protein
VQQYVVLAVVLIIFFGLWLYLWNLDRRVYRLKQEIEEEQHDVD